ncbi:MAG: glycosyltransferase [Nitrososphaeria archaeon]
MSRVIFFSHKKIFENGNNSASDIRFLEMAKVLVQNNHKVTIAEKLRENEEVLLGIRFVGWKNVLSSDLSKEYDVAIVPIWTTEKEVLDRIKNIAIVVDAYAPIVLEQSSRYANKTPSRREVSDFVNYVLTKSNVLLSMADFIMCAGDRQKLYYTGILSALGRINPFSYEEKLIESVPSGVHLKRPVHKKEVFKKIIGENKRIVLWPSTIFPWFDAETAIRAMKIVAEEEKEAVLVFLGATGLPKDSLGYEEAEEAKKLAEKEGILNKNVFFIERIPYQDVESAYLESEIALITYPPGFETEFAFRTRTIHCMWAGLPVICSEGDELAEIIKREGLGVVVKPKDPEVLANSIIRLLKNEQLRAEIAKNGQEYVFKNFSWEKVCKPLEDFCSKPRISESKNFLTPYAIIDEKNRLIWQLEEHLEDYKSKDEKSKQIILKNEMEIEKEQRIIEEQSKEIKRISRKSEQVINELNKEIKNRVKHIESLEITIQQQNQTIKNLEKEIQNKEQTIQQQKEKLDEILNSRWYKFASKIDSLSKKLGIIKK